MEAYMKKNECSAEVVAYSVGPNGKEICTVLLQFHQSVNVDLWKLMANSRQLSFKMRNGTHCLCTATEWDEFFERCHPWGVCVECGVCGVTHNGLKEGDTCPECTVGKLMKCGSTYWENEVNLEFPANRNIQQLVIKMKKAMDASTPKQLDVGEYHLPFITENDRVSEMPWNEEEGIEQFELSDEQLVKLSALRCYDCAGKKKRTVEQELDLCDRVIKAGEVGLFEHQAQAIKNENTLFRLKPQKMPKGLNIRLTSTGDGVVQSFWSGNFQDWIQYKAILEL
jgi:hypothetical protein